MYHMKIRLKPYIDISSKRNQKLPLHGCMAGGVFYNMDNPLESSIIETCYGGLYRENPVKSRNYEAVKSSKKWENVGNSYIIPALLLYRYFYI